MMTDIVERLRAKHIFGAFEIEQQREEAADEIERLRAGNVAQSAWQPIETAPKDGTLVLICGFSPDYFVADAKWDGGYWCLFHPNHDDYTEPCFAASAWQPIPAPPGALPSAQRPQETAADNAALIAAIPEMVSTLSDCMLHLEYANSGFISGSMPDLDWIEKREELVAAARVLLQKVKQP